MAAKGATIPSNKNFANLADTIDTMAAQPNLQSKSVTITSNTTTTVSPDSNYDGLSSVEVTTNVQPNLQTKSVTITSNGTTTVSKDSNYDGMSSVSVTTNIQPNLQSKTVNITNNGTTTVSKDSNYDGMSSVSVTTNVPNKLPSVVDGTATSLTENDLIGTNIIPKYSFSHTPLQNVSIPDSVTQIDNDAFVYGGMANVSIGNGVKIIKAEAFFSCANLTQITIGTGIEQIKEYAFYKCTSLTRITILATTPPALESSTAFSDTNNCEILVPLNSVSAYKSATNWSSLASRINGFVEA